MNDKPLVSICMPVFNGQKYIRKTLDSLVSQDYGNFEIVILDNMSVDDTRKICREYADRDARVRYIPDTVQVGDPEGHHRAALYARGELFMIACDDDIYSPTYISTLWNIMRSDDRIGMAYSGMGYVYEDDTRTPVELKNKYFLNVDNSVLYNFSFYLLHRCPIPLQFGLMKTALHREALKYFYRVDRIGGDHDNLYMLRLLSLTRVASTTERLFHYRIKERAYQLPPESDNVFKRYIARIRHQYRVTRAVGKILDDSPLSFLYKAFLKQLNAVIYVFNCSLRQVIDAVVRYRGGF